MPEDDLHQLQGVACRVLCLSQGARRPPAEQGQTPSTHGCQPPPHFGSALVGRGWAAILR